MNTTSVIISRHWDNPNIEIRVNDISIEIEMRLSDFLDALAKEMGNPTLLITRKQLKAAIDTASEIVTRKMKYETTRVMG